nr:TonB family protein [Blastocatellia bacterium]
GLTMIAVAINIAAQTPPGKAETPPDYKGPVNTVGIASEPADGKQISGGVLNGKAIALPKPPYPAAARAVGASGAVSVQVLIDESGDVVSASPVSGHPLLRAAAAQAARGAKFSPTQLEGMPVKVSGIITYNFVGPLNPARLGFLLGVADRSGSFARYGYPESLAFQMPEDWIQEKEILNSLTFEEAPTVVATAEAAKPAANPAKDSNRYTVMGNPHVYSVAAAKNSAKLDSKSVSALRRLLDLIETRASVNESWAWSNEFGQAMGVLVVEIDDQTKVERNLATIETLVANAPTTVRQGSLELVRDFIAFARTENVSDSGRQGIAEKAEALANLRY